LKNISVVVGRADSTNLQDLEESFGGTYDIAYVPIRRAFSVWKRYRGGTGTPIWIAENIGVFPDVEVELDPALVRQGRNPQLDKAIEIVLDELAKNPLPKPKRPAYPDYHKK
jgi:hypothetical protein